MMPEAEMRDCKDVVLWGGYGWGNVGDELTLAVAIHDLRKAGHDQLTVLSPTPGYTRSLFPDVRIVPYKPVWRKGAGGPLTRWAFRNVFGRRLPGEGFVADRGEDDPLQRWDNVISRAKMLYLVGGGYLTDLFDFYRFLAPVEVALLRGIPIQTAPLGIGPFSDLAAERSFVRTFNDTLLTVRDPVSENYCRSLGLTVARKPDDGFRIQEVLDSSPFVPADAPTPTIGINFFPQHGSISAARLRKWWTEFLALACDNEMKLEGFCFHVGINADYDPLVELFHSVGLPTWQVTPPVVDFRVACLRLRTYSCVISSRFHAAVACSSFKIPCLAVSCGPYYDAKMAAACSSESTSAHVNAGIDTPAKAFNIVTTLLRSHSERSS